MDLKVDRAQASGNAFLFLALTTALGGGLIYIFWSGRFADEGPFGWVLFFIFSAWIFAFLIAWTLRLFRLRKFEGPVLRITESGIVDFWTIPHQTLAWDEINYTEWKNPTWHRYWCLSLKIRAPSIFCDASLAYRTTSTVQSI